MTNKDTQTSRLIELGTAPVGKTLLKYSLPAVVGCVVMAVYNIIDSVVIGHAINDPNVVSGIAVTFPVMNLATALGTLIGVGSATRISIVMGQLIITTHSPSCREAAPRIFDMVQPILHLIILRQSRLYRKPFKS